MIMARRIVCTPIFWTVLLLDTSQHISQTHVIINWTNIGFNLKCTRRRINLHCNSGHIGLALFYNPPGWKNFLVIMGMKMSSAGFLPGSSPFPHFQTPPSYPSVHWAPSSCFLWQLISIGGPFRVVPVAWCRWLCGRCVWPWGRMPLCTWCLIKLIVHLHLLAVLWEDPLR